MNKITPPIRSRRIVIALVLAIAIAQFLTCHTADSNAQSRAVAAQSLASDSVQTFYTNQNKFQIPFNINPNGRKLVEVQLFVSTDRGREWELYSRKDMNHGHFQYQSSTDREIWFSIKSIDRDQRVFPSGPNGPDLKIIVDTKKPALQIHVQPDAAGRIVTAIHAHDENFDPEGIRIEYRRAGATTEKWIDSGFVNRNAAISNTFQDQIAWWPNRDIASLDVQVTIQDRAGNKMVSTQTVTVPGSARINQKLLSQNSPAKPPTTLPASPHNSLPARNASHRRTLSSDQYFQAPNGRETAAQVSKQPGRQQDVNWPSQQQESSHTQVTRSTLQNHPVQQRNRSNLAAGDQRSGGNDHSTYSPASNRNLIVSEGSTHPNLNRSSSASGTNKANEAKMESSIPADASPTTQYRLSNLIEIARPTNQKKFLLTYDVDAIAENEIKEVGLWMTHDGGQNWRKWAIDTDKQSPFAVTVPKQGVYGFRIVISSVDGINSRIPRGGEAADMWVRYDNTRPRIQITSVPYGRGVNAGKLVINWKAEDEQLTLRPITLSYSDRPEGPWTHIATGLRNSGNFVWKVPSHVPDKIFLQLTARDTAGNVANYQLGNAVNVANLIPKGRIKDLMPVPSKSGRDADFKSAQDSTESRAQVTGFKNIDSNR